MSTESKKPCLGELYANISKYKANSPEIKEAVRVYMQATEKIDVLAKQLKNGKIFDDPLIARANHYKSLIPSSIRYHEWSNSNQIDSFYKELWQHMGSTSGLYLEVVSESVWIHIHPLGLCLQWFWINKDGYEEFVRYTKTSPRFVYKTPKNRYGWLSTLYFLPDDKQ